jgi:hypothetical protein
MKNMLGVYKGETEEELLANAKKHGMEVHRCT